MSNRQQPIESAMRRFADALQATYATAIKAQPEDQLKQPVRELLASVGAALGWAVDSRTEVAAPSVGGRPDLGVMLKGLLSGHVELKAPGKGARSSPTPTTRSSRTPMPRPLPIPCCWHASKGKRASSSTRPSRRCAAGMASWRGRSVC